MDKNDIFILRSHVVKWILSGGEDKDVLDKITTYFKMDPIVTRFICDQTHDYFEHPPIEDLQLLTESLHKLSK